MKNQPDNQQESNLPTKLAQPARRELVGAGYLLPEQLSQITQAEIRQLHGIGPNALNQLRSALDAVGLSFADERETQE